MFLFLLTAREATLSRNAIYGCEKVDPVTADLGSGGRRRRVSAGLEWRQWFWSGRRKWCRFIPALTESGRLLQLDLEDISTRLP